MPATTSMKLQFAAFVTLALSGCRGFVPSSRRIIPRSPSTASSIAHRSHAIIASSLRSPLSRQQCTSALRMASSEDFDQTKYTEAAWATLAALPACAQSYMSTVVEAPMLLAILLNPTKYQAGEYSLHTRGNVHANSEQSHSYTQRCST